MDTDQTRRTLDNLREVVAAIERGELEATRAQRAYLAGAVDTLAALLVAGRAEAESAP